MWDLKPATVLIHIESRPTILDIDVSVVINCGVFELEATISREHLSNHEAFFQSLEIVPNIA